MLTFIAGFAACAFCYRFKNGVKARWNKTAEKIEQKLNS